jgi:hypothetical protein
MSSQGVLAVVAALALFACSNSPSAEEQVADMQAGNEELRARIRKLEEQLETSRAAAEDVKLEAEEVQAVGAQREARSMVSAPKIGATWFSISRAQPAR